MSQEFIWSDGSKPAWKQVPDGLYPSCEFQGVEPFDKSKFSKAVKWKFKVLGGEHANSIITHLTNIENDKGEPAPPTPNNKLGRILAQVLGKTPRVGDKVAIDTMIGKKYQVMVVDGKVAKVTLCPMQ